MADVNAQLSLALCFSIVRLQLTTVGVCSGRGQVYGYNEGAARCQDDG